MRPHTEQLEERRQGGRPRRRDWPSGRSRSFRPALWRHPMPVTAPVIPGAPKLFGPVVDAGIPSDPHGGAEDDT